MLGLFKKYLGIILIVFCVSCVQDPMKDIPEIIRESAYTNEKDKRSIFDKRFFSRDFILLTVNGGRDLKIYLKEGESLDTRIKIRSLHKDPAFKDIDVDLKLDPLSFNDSNFKWSYNQNRKEIELSWTPEENFTKFKSVKKLQIPIILKFPSLNSKNVPLIIKRNLELIVEKNYEKPEIISVQLDFDKYQKLEDGNFYNIPLSFNKLFLNLNRPIYRENSDGDSMILVKQFGNQYDFQLGKYYDLNYLYQNPSKVLHAKNKESDNENIHEFLQRHINDVEVYVRLRKKLYEKKQGRNCAFGKNVCYDEIPNLKNDDRMQINIDSDVYETYYEIPEKLFYKNNNQIKNVTLDSRLKIYQRANVNNCAILSVPQKKVIQIPAIGEKGKEVYCYVSVTLGDLLFKREDLYYIPKNSVEELYVISKDQLKEKFRLVPKYLKLRLAGYKPNDFKLIFHRDHQKKLDFKIAIRDKNYSKQGPVLSFLEIFKNEYWDEDNDKWFPPLIRNFKNKKILSSDQEDIKGDFWLFEYELDYKHFTESLGGDYELKEKNKSIGPNDFNSELFKISPSSYSKTGKKVEFKIHTFPFIKNIFHEKFNQNYDYVPGKHLKFSHSFKTNYIFPEKSLESFLNIVPIQKKLTRVDIKSLLDIIRVDFDLFKSCLYQFNLDSDETERNAYGGSRSPSKNNDQSLDASPSLNINYIAQVQCSCLPFEQIKNDINKDIIGTQCNFDTTLDLDSKEREPFYTAYAYGIQKNDILLEDDIFDIRTNNLNIRSYLIETDESDLSNPNAHPFSIDLLKQNDSDLDRFNQDIGLTKRKSLFGKVRKLDLYISNQPINIKHLFFNFQASINCENIGNSRDRSCKIYYDYKKKSKNNIMMEQEFKDAFTMDLICKDINGKKHDCICSDEVNLFGFSISKTCTFKDGEHGSIIPILKTNREDIFFLSTDKQARPSMKKIQGNTLLY